MCWKGVLLASKQRLELLQRKMKCQPGLYLLTRMFLRFHVENGRSLFVVGEEWGLAASVSTFPWHVLKCHSAKVKAPERSLDFSAGFLSNFLAE